MMPISTAGLRNVRRWSAAGGFSLIELMVALTLGLLLVAAAATLFVNGRSNFRQDVAVSGLQDNGRFAVAQLEEDAAMAGYWSEVFNPANIALDSSIPSSTSASDCTSAAGFGGAFGGFQGSVAKSYGAVMYPIASLNNATATQATATFPCIKASDFQAGTDILLVRRLVGLPETSATVGNFYLNEPVTPTISASLSGAPPVPPVTVPPTPPNYYWPYRISLFYIRNYSVTAGDGIPTLCRKYLASTTAGWISDCAAEGIENLQVEFGISNALTPVACAALTNPVTVAPPSYYTSSPSLTELQQAVTVRISILARAATKDFKYSNGKTYTVGDSPAYAPGDNYHRQLIVSDVFLRNPTGLAIAKCNGF